MGCFSSICNGCGTAINGDCIAGGELCVLIHVRHGKEIGLVEGHYNEYGSVIEEEAKNKADRFCGDAGPNSHEEICKSKFDLPDSGKKSGIEAWHKKCYDTASAEKKDSHIISDDDPKQGRGPIRTKFL